MAVDEEGRPRFQLLQKRIHLADSSAIEKLRSEIPAHYFVFDLIACQGYDLRGITLAERRQILQALVPEGEFIRCTSTSGGPGGELLRLACSKGLEGILAKDLTSTYESMRSRQWLKIKCLQQQEFVIGGYTEPSGSRRYFGALLLGLYEEGNLVYAGRTGSGFDEEMLDEVYRELEKRKRRTCPFKSVPEEVQVKSWLRPELVCEVKFNEWTRDGLLRSPVFLGLRSDINPRECQRESPERPQSPEETRIGLPYDFISNPGKVFWPEEGYTKGDLIQYYHEMAEVLVPYLEDRPMVLERFPDGIDGESFYQKNAPDFLPDWIATVPVQSDSAAKTIHYILCNDARTLVYLANLACISLHPWSSRAGQLENPDFLILDLDPGEGVLIATVCKVAQKIREISGTLELESYPKTSGATGIHVLVPLESGYGYDDVRNFAEIIARLVVAELPEISTLERSVEKRPKKVYVDYLQNGLGKTIVSPYCVRPRPHAPVSTPLEWKEVNARLRPEAFNLKTIFRRLDRKGDLFEAVRKNRQSLHAALERLQALWRGHEKSAKSRH